MEHETFNAPPHPVTGTTTAKRPPFRLPWKGFLLLLVLGGLVVAPLFVWFYCRIEVPEGYFVPLMRKGGDDMTNKMVLADPGFRGPQFEILREGRHWRNPYTWWWPKPIKATVIPNLSVGVLVRKYGQPLPEGEVVARDDQHKGILPDIRAPGRYYINTWAYDVETHPMVKIEPGYMGVVTLRVGKAPQDPNVFVVNAGERGTQPALLPPGTHPQYSNPYIYEVTPIDVRSQKFEMAGDTTITFPSKYGFDIIVEGTIEWAPDVSMLPEVFVKYVDEADLKDSGGINNIQRKVILPLARSFFRTIGGEHRAVDYITGDTRIRVQSEVERRLRESCAAEGVLIRSFVIRSTEPPQQIRQQYERREIARRETDQFLKEIETQIGQVVVEGATPKLDAQGRPVLDEFGRAVTEGGKTKLDEMGRPLRQGGRLAKVIQERRKDRESQFGEIRVQVAEEVRSAEQYSKVEVTKAAKDLAVAKVMLEAAKDQAAKALAEGKAEADVMVMKYNAEAEAVGAKVAAFGTGDKYAEYQLILKMSPGIQHILSNTDGLFAQLFQRFATLETQTPNAPQGDR
ncbi:MAG: hypothetical protein JXL80_06985 [Planctomycetes bacterium]|nr:hypothetical protein [Planctomycetota bacterium]